MTRCAIAAALLCAAVTMHAADAVVVKFREGAAPLRGLPVAAPDDGIPRLRNVELPDGMTQSGAYMMKWLGMVVPHPTVGLDRIFTITTSDPGATMDALRARGDVEWAEVEGVWKSDAYWEEPQSDQIMAPEDAMVQHVPNDPKFPEQWSLNNTGQVVASVPGKPGADVNMQRAWSITTGSADMLLAVLDSGQPPGADAMPDFQGRLEASYDFINEDSDPADDHGHGSNVMSIMAARGDDNSLMAGVNWNARILSVKVLGSDNTGTWSAIARGVVLAVNRGTSVLNMSIGGDHSLLLDDAFREASQASVVSCACMMNDNTSSPMYPAALSREPGFSVIAVGATNHLDIRAVPFCSGSGGAGSNYGEHLDVVAPGNYILGISRSGGTSRFCGTSQASPIVAGIASLVRSIRPEFTFEQVRAVITQSAVDQVGPGDEDLPGYDRYYGYGRVDAYAALAAAGGTGVSDSEVPANARVATQLLMGNTYRAESSCQVLEFRDILGSFVLRVDNIVAGAIVRLPLPETALLIVTRLLRR